MGYLVCEYLGNSGGYTGCDAWLIHPNFTPRKAEFGSKLKELQASGALLEGGEGSGKQGLEALPETQREELREKLHNGRGDMTLQEWDDFLADLVDWGIITEKERGYANGTDSACPPGGMTSVRPQDYERFGPNPLTWMKDGLTYEDTLKDDLWTGDPMKFLHGLDAYNLRRAADWNLLGATSSEREAIRKVGQILQEILW